METTRVRMIAVAVLVCFFAVGMAGLLNYFKYRATSDRIVKERLMVIADSVNSSIHSSLTLGLQFSDLAMLPSTMERERAADDLILGIEVFDTDGKPLYSTDRLRAGRTASKAWLEAAQGAPDNDGDWYVTHGSESAVGITIKNNFGLKIGYLAVRFSDERISQANAQVAKELALSALSVFALAALVASLALLAVMRKLTSDIAAVEATLTSQDPNHLPEAVRRGPFGSALRRFFDTVRLADGELQKLRMTLDRGARS